MGFSGHDAMGTTARGGSGGNPQPWETAAVLSMVGAAFGPYLVGSIRTEQVAVYALTVVVIVALPRLVVPTTGSLLLVGTSGVLLVGLFGVLLPPSSEGPLEQGRLLGGIDNLALPVAVLLIVWCLVSPPSAPRLLVTGSKVIVWGMALNGAVSIVSTRTSLVSSLRPFWGELPVGTLTGVAERASQLGRFSGIFNQPAEAGLMYGLAALLTVYSYGGNRPKMLFALCLITAGGLISVSKIFILLGLPLTLWYLWRSQTLSRRLGLLVTLPLIVLGTAQSGLFQGWSGLNYLGRLLAPAENASLIEFYSAGRFASGSSVNNVITSALDVSPITGVGADGWAVAYDSGWAEVLVVSGLVGAAFHVLTLASLLLLARRTIDPRRRALTLYVTILLIGADLGIPALTANRAATAIWTCLALLALANHADEASRPARISKRQNRASPDGHHLTSGSSTRDASDE